DGFFMNVIFFFHFLQPCFMCTPVSVFNIKCFKRRKWDSLIFTDVTILYLISIFKRYDNLSNTRKWTGFVSLVGYFFIVIYYYICLHIIHYFHGISQDVSLNI